MIDDLVDDFLSLNPSSARHCVVTFRHASLSQYQAKHLPIYLETHMSYLFALFHKLVPEFHEPNLPLDTDYSYQARQREAERIRKSRGSIMGIRL